MLSYISMIPITIVKMLYFLLITSMVQSQLYDGPVTIDYFQHELVTNTAQQNIQEISCGNNVFLTTTDSNNPVHYYRLILTSNMKQTYIHELEITTCCKFCDYTYESLYAAELADFDVVQEQLDKKYNMTYYTNWMDACNKRQFGQRAGVEMDDLSVNKSITEATNNVNLEIAYNQYCDGNDSSLDTYLYLLQYKKGKVLMVGQSDDVSSSQCANTEKSYIDLLDYPEGEYIIAIAGFGQEYGSYFFQLRCSHYTFPLDAAQLKPFETDTVLELKCGRTLSDQQNTEISQVQYYQINITKSLLKRLPITVSTCSESYDSYMYIFKEVNEQETTTFEYGIIGQNDDNPSCGNYLDSKYELTHEEILNEGIYYVAIQGIRNQPGIFDISMECNTIPPSSHPSFLPTLQPSKSPTSSPTVPPKIPKSVITSLLFGSMGIALFIIGCYYLHKWRRFRKEKQELDDKKKKKKLKNKVSTDSFESVPNEDEAFENEDDQELLSDNYDTTKHKNGKKNKKKRKDKKSITIPRATMQSQPTKSRQNGSRQQHQHQHQLKPLSKRERSQRRQLKKNTGTSSLRGLAGLQAIAEDFGAETDINSEHSYHLENLDLNTIMNIEEARGDTVRGIKIQRIDGDATLASQLDGDDDVISLVLAHAIQCCEDQNGLDIFQVLAVRWYEKNSRNISAVRPFERIGINIECIKVSPLVQTCIMAVCTMVAQTYGLTTVVYGLVSSYFTTSFDNVNGRVCDMNEDRWNSVIHYKLLAFFLSLIVTFVIGDMLNEIKHSGLNEIIEILKIKHIKRVPNIATAVLQLGQAINYYVALWAVIGSYFIIFEANQGDELDDGTVSYSHSGLDMILNAVALFFMLELDDMLVSEQDYVDCEDHLRETLKAYRPDTSINEEYMTEEDFEREEEQRRMQAKSHKTYLNLRDNTINSNTSNSTNADEERSRLCSCLLSLMYYVINTFSVFVTCICFISGFFAPFLIFFCW